MNVAAPPLDLTALIDARPVSRFQVWMLVLLGASVVMDGFDAQAMGFVAPAIIRAWGVDKAALGPVFGASLMGMLVGSLVLSPLADRIGRRPVLIGSTVFFALCMLATPFATDLASCSASASSPASAWAASCRTRWRSPASTARSGAA